MLSLNSSDEALAHSALGHSCVGSECSAGNYAESDLCVVSVLTRTGESKDVKEKCMCRHHEKAALGLPGEGTQQE